MSDESILATLASQVGDRDFAANRAAAERCLASPSLLDDIDRGLGSRDPKLAADCAEVLTVVGQTRPELLAPFVDSLIARLDARPTRLRWEAMHALALVAGHVPAKIEPLLPRLFDIFSADQSIIVRDRAVEAVGRFAGAGAREAALALEWLDRSLRLWDGRQAGPALIGLREVVLQRPDLGARMRDIGQRYLDFSGFPKGAVRQAAKRLVAATKT
ncbi:MAG: hypothetical protein U0821_25775 [Chloroflexota bacterium]